MMEFTAYVPTEKTTMETERLASLQESFDGGLLTISGTCVECGAAEDEAEHCDRFCDGNVPLFTISFPLPNLDSSF